MTDSEGLQEQLATLQTESECLRQTNRRLAQHVLDLESQIVRLQGSLSPMPHVPALPVDALGTAITDAFARANANLAREKGEIHYPIAELSCDIKGFLDLVDSSLTILPANGITVQATDSMSVIRFGLGSIPTGKSSPPRN